MNKIKKTINIIIILSITMISGCELVKPLLLDVILDEKEKEAIINKDNETDTEKEESEGESEKKDSEPEENIEKDIEEEKGPCKVALECLIQKTNSSLSKAYSQAYKSIDTVTGNQKKLLCENYESASIRYSCN